MQSDTQEDQDDFSPSFAVVADWLRAEFSPAVTLNDETELAGLKCRSPIGDIDVFVRRSTHGGVVYLEVNMYGLGHVMPPVAVGITRLIDQVNDFGLGGVVMVLEGAIVFRQSIAVEQEHLNCWQSRLRFMLVQGMQMALRVKLYLSRNLTDAELDDAGDTSETTDPSPRGRIDLSWN